jgi:GTP:adenosylcobinamide-phosphate guanylyltransferase
MTAAKMGWTAIVLAGQRPGIDPLAAHFGIEWKAMVSVAGEAMLTHVVRSLRASPEIARIIILAQKPEAMANAIAVGGGADAVIESQSSISASIAAVVGSADAPWPVLITTADHVLLTPATLSQFLRDSAGAELSVGMVEKANMLKSFPDARRTWLKFADGHWSGANLFALQSKAAFPALSFWAEAEQDRKVPWKLFRHFGLWLTLRALTRTIGLADGLALAGKRLGLKARLVPMDDPVAAIDVDKPADHSQAEAILAQRAVALRI